MLRQVPGQQQRGTEGRVKCEGLETVSKREDTLAES